MLATFDDWTEGREIASIGTNHGSAVLPFQYWKHFKEAYAPELINLAITKCKRSVQRCLDPFGGSGTTALACQFLGVKPFTIEVNPFLADLITAKLASYDSDKLARDFGYVVSQAKQDQCHNSKYNRHLPPTFIEPGVKGRWLFSKETSSRIFSYLAAIDQLTINTHKNLFKIILGGILVKVSNATVNGKGRRYKKNWECTQSTPFDVDSLFSNGVHQAIIDIHRYRHRRCLDFNVYNGDSRNELPNIETCDISIFSPPYPNSFDYTDVYNIELWMLGYLNNQIENNELRSSTLCSHVQVKREYPKPPKASSNLLSVLDRLDKCRSTLWNKNIPEMIGGYFFDLNCILGQLTLKLSDQGEVWMVVGDSKYRNIHIKTADILIELAENIGFDLVKYEAFRSMRVSPQQGGNSELAESLIVLRKH